MFRRLALGLAVAAVAVPSAQAQIHQREAAETAYAFVLDGIGYPAPDGREWPGVDPNVAPYEGESRAHVLAPGEPAWPGVNPSAVPSDAGPKSPVHVDAPSQVVTKPDGFDWGDASVGAGMVATIMLLGAGALVATRHVSGPATT